MNNLTLSGVVLIGVGLLILVVYLVYVAICVVILLWTYETMNGYVVLCSVVPIVAGFALLILGLN